MAFKTFSQILALWPPQGASQADIHVSEEIKLGGVVIFASLIESGKAGDSWCLHQCCLHFTRCLCGARGHTVSLLLDFFLFCWHLKLVYLWIVFKRMIMWILCPLIQCNTSVCRSCCLNFGCHPYSRLICFSLLCPCVRLRRAYCWAYITFWVHNSFSVKGWILLCFNPCDPVSGQLSLRIHCWVIILKPLALLPIKQTWTHNNDVLNRTEKLGFLFQKMMHIWKKNVCLKSLSPPHPPPSLLLLNCSQSVKA